jgi:patatin-like phospholipase/acyl hydrolase
MNSVLPAAQGFGEPCRLLSLDGGGGKSLYTLGLLKEIEAMLGQRLYERFDLIFGTSTGAIIAATALTSTSRIQVCL